MEMGGANSHGAVVAREYGIPAVVGVAGATGRIRTGTPVTVDGAAGLVRLPDGAAQPPRPEPVAARAVSPTRRWNDDQVDASRPAAEDPPPRWLEGVEAQAWLSLIGVIIRLPAALDTQLQRDAGLSHFEYIVMVNLSNATDHVLRMSQLAAQCHSSLSGCRTSSPGSNGAAGCAGSRAPTTGAPRWPG